jgi:hypothetical protein
MNSSRLKILARAAKTSLERDAMVRLAGFAALSDCPPDLIVRTAILALECGLKTNDWNCVAEAADMLAKMAGYYPWLLSAAERDETISYFRPGSAEEKAT